MEERKKHIMEKTFYSPSEVRKILGLKCGKVYEMLEDGTIPSVKIGTRWKISKDALTEWIAEETRRQTEERRKK